MLATFQSSKTLLAIAEPAAREFQATPVRHREFPSDALIPLARGFNALTLTSSYETPPEDRLLSDDTHLDVRDDALLAASGLAEASSAAWTMISAAINKVYPGRSCLPGAGKRSAARQRNRRARVSPPGCVSFPCGKGGGVAAKPVPGGSGFLALSSLAFIMKMPWGCSPIIFSFCRMPSAVALPRPVPRQTIAGSCPWRSPSRRGPVPPAR